MNKSQKWFKTHHPDKCKKKAIIFQNVKFFLLPSLKYERVNPTHKTIVWGLKKKKYHSSRHRNYEKVAILLRNWYYIYLFGLAVNIIVLLFS